MEYGKLHIPSNDIHHAAHYTIANAPYRAAREMLFLKTVRTIDSFDVIKSLLLHTSNIS
jgi:hypothetical protein